MFIIAQADQEMISLLVMSQNGSSKMNSIRAVTSMSVLRFCLGIVKCATGLKPYCVQYILNCHCIIGTGILTHPICLMEMDKMSIFSIQILWETLRVVLTRVR